MTTILRQYGLLTQWQLRRQSGMLPLLIVVQAGLAVGTVLGFGILMGDVGTAAELFLVTGAPTVTLIAVGLVMAPQQLSQSKIEGSAQWLMTLPVKRLTFLMADLTMWTIIALPGTVLALLVGVLRYDVSLDVSVWAVPAALLISLTAAALGYAMSALLPPMVAMLITQLLVFTILLFTPISVPASNFPDWLASVHQVLPLEPMADLLRASLSSAFSVSTGSILVLIAWCVAAVTAAGLALKRRF